MTRRTCPACQKATVSDSGAFGRCHRCSSLIRLREPHVDRHDELYFDSDSGLEMTPRELIRQYLDHVETRCSLEDARVVDVGCGVSDTWRQVTERGARYVGVEPSQRARAKMRQRGVEVCRSVQHVSRPDFDVGLVIEVIEHTYEAREMLSELRDVISDEGFLFVATPNALSLRARLRGENWEQARNPTHVCLFSRAALVETLNDAGYRPISWQRRVANPDPLARRLFQRGLQMVGLDGGLRVLAKKVT